MSHHYSGPDWGFPHGDASLDITDLYAFPKLGDAGKSNLIMNVHPSSGVNPPGPTPADPFAPEALYELKIDTDGNPVADIAYGCAPRPPKAGRRPRRCAALRERRLRGGLRRAGYRPGRAGLDGAEVTGDGGR
jgi:Domain of unknown function (DUF4331)